MNTYKIAELRLNMKAEGKILKKQADGYRTEEKQRKNPHLSMDDCEYIWTGSEFYQKFLDFNGFMLHASAVAMDGKAYLFSAKSGIIDWFSRRIVGFSLSNTLEKGFVIETVKKAINQYGKPEILNSYHIREIKNLESLETIQMLDPDETSPYRRSNSVSVSNSGKAYAISFENIIRYTHASDQGLAEGVELRNSARFGKR